MARLLTLSTIRTRCKRRADQENASFISDAEWNALISEKWGELFGVIADAGSRYFETTQSITATGATSYTEPSDLRDDLALDYLYSDGRRRALTRLRLTETNAYAGLTGDAYAFSHVDDQIFLHPNPSSGSYQFRYIPQATDLSNSADNTNVDVVNEYGEAMLIWGVAAIAKTKAESNAIEERREEAKAMAKLEAWAARNAIADGRRTPAEDIEGNDFVDPADWRYRT